MTDSQTVPASAGFFRYKDGRTGLGPQLLHSSILRPGSALTLTPPNPVSTSYRN